jgi:hypothetical protein
MRPAPLFTLLTLGGCALSSGIRQIGPDAYTVSEVRAPVRGGGAEAERVVLAEADDFCRRHGRVFVPMVMTQAGNPYGIYGPSGFNASFRCLLPQQPAAR